MKKDIIYIIIIVLLLGGAGGAGYWFYTDTQKNFEEALSTERAAYASVVSEYEATKQEIDSNIDAWKTRVKEMEDSLSDTQKKLEESNNELNAIYEERRVAAETEAARWDALTDEEKKAEEKILEYNEMVKTLRAENTEYEEAYVKLTEFFGMSYDDLDKDQKKDYTKYISDKTKIESEYIKKKVEAAEAGDVSGNDVSENN